MVLEYRKKVTGNRDFRGCSQAKTGRVGGENASECRAPPRAFDHRIAYDFHPNLLLGAPSSSDRSVAWEKHART